MSTHRHPQRALLTPYARFRGGGKFLHALYSFLPNWLRVTVWYFPIRCNSKRASSGKMLTPALMTTLQHVLSSPRCNTCCLRRAATRVVCAETATYENILTLLLNAGVISVNPGVTGNGVGRGASGGARQWGGPVRLLQARRGGRNPLAQTSCGPFRTSRNVSAFLKRIHVCIFTITVEVPVLVVRSFCFPHLDLEFHKTLWHTHQLQQVVCPMGVGTTRIRSPSSRHRDHVQPLVVCNPLNLVLRWFVCAKVLIF